MLLRLIISALVSIAIYLGIFGFVLGRPLTVGTVFKLMDVKVTHAKSAHEPQIFVVAGSNARFSHSCVVLSETLGRPCTNMGIAAGIGLDYFFGKILPLVRPKDLVYMPLEYLQYDLTQSEMFFSADTGERFLRDKKSLLNRGIKGVTQAAFSFDLSYGIQAIYESAFAAMGGHRRMGLHTINAMGDEIGHDLEKSKPYRQMLEQIKWKSPSLATIFSPKAMEKGGSPEVIANFIRGCEAKGATVVGGLPTTLNDTPVSKQVIDRIAEFYKENGAAFVVMKNRSQYPRTSFYDTEYHLNEPAQIAHSKMLAAYLRPYIH